MSNPPTCFKCKEQIMYKPGVLNKWGKPQAFNLDGETEHWTTCTARKQNQQQQSTEPNNQLTMQNKDMLESALIAAITERLQKCTKQLAEITEEVRLLLLLNSV